MTNDELIKRAGDALLEPHLHIILPIFKDLLTALKGKDEAQSDNIKKLMKYKHCGHHDEFWSECYSCNNPPTGARQNEN
jgi:hypothetical protein